VFVRKYDWEAVQRFHDSGRTARECAERYGFSNGAWHHALKRGYLVAREPQPTRPRAVTRRDVERLLAAGLSQAEISKQLGVGSPTVCFHARNLGVPANPEFAKRFDWAEIRAYYEAGHSMRDCLRQFRFSRSAWADAIKRGAIVPRPRLEPIEQILTTGRRRSRFHVKARLLLAA
jgi:hypothetical protein